MSTLGATINNLRKEKGLTLVQLGKEVGLTQGYLSNIENDNKIPSPEVLSKLSKVLECNDLFLMLKAGHINKEAEESIDFLNTLWSEDGKEYKLVLVDEDISREAHMNLMDVLKSERPLLYKGLELSPEDKKRILDMLEVLFPQYQDKKE